ncbi:MULTISPECIES: TetR/AcrR family transcriptional regulator [Streptomyces]|uniref:TetR/AcrR family transcriptional regulator n=1 Tax=Streptomyces violaceolatus TaxID=67378 RepID=A0ABN3SQL7_9ACTN|nr:MULTISPECIES: TetR family transcriptional regulator [Streptomyces]WTC06451.1 TetR family transcriptional regulator [Streptomyces anthocyanicus]MDX3397615.1 TetR family transcriptional regulator [Streptomyces sp. ME01-18h]MDX3407279.1 TetR family transcriptional regulator [Streptomyces sp. ME02-6977A]PSK61112.1 HTH-type transcriptional regulator EthR [Streptomyces sp. 111WW2]REH18577.1 transcriptional regulator /TetR family transcriptional regulator [Streptomyces sp. 2221.1]
MTNFQRARSEEQRAVRRQAILDTTAAMLEEMPVGEVSLNELSRRVGLAKSNVLRYFESREAILLELLDRAWQQWVADLPALVHAGVDQGAPVSRRAEQFAAVIAASLAGRQVLCDLLSAQAGVLEHNVSPQVAARYKRAAVANVADIAALAHQHLPELGASAPQLTAAMIMAVGAVWTHARPSPAMLSAYEADPSLTAFKLDFVTTLQEMLATLTAGTIARESA